MAFAFIFSTIYCVAFCFIICVLSFLNAAIKRAQMQGLLLLFGLSLFVISFCIVPAPGDDLLHYYDMLKSSETLKSYVTDFQYASTPLIAFFFFIIDKVNVYNLLQSIPVFFMTMVYFNAVCDFFKHRDRTVIPCVIILFLILLMFNWGIRVFLTVIRYPLALSLCFLSTYVLFVRRNGFSDGRFLPALILICLPLLVHYGAFPICCIQVLVFFRNKRNKIYVLLLIGLLVLLIVGGGYWNLLQEKSSSYKLNSAPDYRLAILQYVTFFLLFLIQIRYQKAIKKNLSSQYNLLCIWVFVCSLPFVYFYPEIFERMNQFTVIVSVFSLYVFFYQRRTIMWWILFVSIVLCLVLTIAYYMVDLSVALRVGFEINGAY